MGDNNSTCLWLIAFLLYAVFKIAAIIIAYTNLENSCYNLTPVNISLAHWLGIYSIISLIIEPLIFTICTVCLKCKDQVDPCFTTGWGCCLVGPYVIFAFSWNVLGAVILFGQSFNCLNESTTVWVISFIGVIFYLIIFSIFF